MLEICMQIKICIVLLVILCYADYAFDFVAEDGIGLMPKRSIKKRKTQVFKSSLMSASIHASHAGST